MADCATPVLWIAAPAASDELALARDWAATLVNVVEVGSPVEAVDDPPACFVDRSPAVILVASPATAAWRLDDFLAVSRRWPLAPVVSVSATLVEGRRRSGPALPGVEEVAWTDLRGRLACWLLDRTLGVPGTLGLPATSRRDERILESTRRITQTRPRAGVRVEVAASRLLDLEGITDLVAACGHEVVGRRIGRPPIDHHADVVVWDTGDLAQAHVTWLGMVAANRPLAPIVVLDSFPRADTAAPAMRAGAAAILARPVPLDVLAGVLLHVASRPRRMSCD
jgi:hypothetical protein